MLNFGIKKREMERILGFGYIKLLSSQSIGGNLDQVGYQTKTNDITQT